MENFTKVSISSELFSYFKKKADQKVGPSAKSVINEALALVKRLWELRDSLERTEKDEKVDDIIAQIMEKVKILKLSSDDTVVITLPDTIHFSWHATITERVQEIFPDNKVIVKPAGVSIEKDSK